MSSRVGYGKSGTFEVYSGYGNNTLSYFIGGVSGEYRNLKFLKPATGELKTWLEANAVKMPLTGTWVFNEKLTAANPPLRTDIAFTSNGTEFTNMNKGRDLEPTESYYLFYNDTKVNSNSAYTGNWVNSAYRTITFTQPVQYEGNEEFVRWFVDNAAPPPSDIMPGNYQFNLRLTSMPFAKDTSVPVNFKCFFGGSGEPKYVTHDAILFRTSSMSNYIDYKLVGSSISNGVYTWDYDGEAQNSWGNQAYRTITLTTPIKYADNPEFYNWFVENTYFISKVLPAGTYLLKDNNDIDTKGYAGKDLEGVILFKSNNSIYSWMLVLYIPNLLMYDKTNVASSATWHDQNYRTIETFYEQPVTEDFYNWFTQNVTTKQ